MVNQDKSNFATGSIPGHIMYLAVPMIISQLVQMLYNIVDRIYIGHIPGTGGMALTGLGLTFPVITLIMAFTNLYATGGTPLFSMARGAKNSKRAQNTLDTVFTLILINSILLLILLYPFLRELLYSLGASDKSYPYARDYLIIYLIGTPFLMESTGLTGFINAQGNSFISMGIVLSGVIINIILDPIFIFMLRMGITGAALATIISQLISFILLILYFRSRKTIFKLKLSSLKISKELLKPIYSLGLSGFCFQATNSAVQLVCNLTLSQYGGDIYIGIMAVLNSIRELMSAPLTGMTNGAQPVISFNYGARKFERIWESIRFITFTSVSIMLIFWIALLTFPDEIMSLFTNSKEIIDSGSDALFYYFFGFFLMAFQFCGQTTFTALGCAKEAVFFSLFRKAILVIPLTLILPRLFNLGVMGVFIAEPVSNLVGGLCCYFTMLYKTRILLKT